MNRVKELQRVRSEIEGLKDDYERLSVPIVLDMGLISNLYDVFSMSLKRQAPDASPRDTNSRKKFLYAILYLFSPATLVGDVMRHRLREYISGVIGCTPTGVSRDYKTAMFFYSTYKTFQDEVNEVIRDMLCMLGKESEI